MVTMAIPIFTAQETGSAGKSDSVASRTEYYTTAKNLLVSGADAMERLMTAYKEIVELAGYTGKFCITTFLTANSAQCTVI